MPAIFGAIGERADGGRWFWERKKGEGEEEDAEPEEGDVPEPEVQPNSGGIRSEGVVPDPDPDGLVEFACAACCLGDEPFPLEALPSGETPFAASSGLPSSGSDSAESGYISRRSISTSHRHW